MTRLPLRLDVINEHVEKLARRPEPDLTDGQQRLLRNLRCRRKG